VGVDELGKQNSLGTIKTGVTAGCYNRLGEDGNLKRRGNPVREQRPAKALPDDLEEKLFTKRDKLSIGEVRGRRWELKKKNAIRGRGLSTGDLGTRGEKAPSSRTGA